MTTHDDDSRPDPDALLERVNAADEAVDRTRLLLWFGASPGVGKTYSMLQRAQRLRSDGVDVVVGVVETHGRAETAALLAGLEVVPLKRVLHRGRTLEEFDIDAVLARKPKVVLLDELAHTNAPGSRHKKRWQDATELLEAGIEVHSTLNVQHVESLNDVVAQITHIRVRETVPDALVERADAIELVDVPPEVVLTRLREGKVYVADQAERAARGFFQEGNLHALRELALRVTAERVDAEVLAWRRQHGVDGTWATRERILVCVGPSPASARLVRTARRMATALRAPWLAAYVEGPVGSAPSQADRTRLAAHLRLAESLGAEVVVVSGARSADALLELARRRNVTRIICGKPTHARWRDAIYGSLLDDLVRGSGAIDVHVVAGEPEPSSPILDAGAPSTRPKLVAYLQGAVPVVAAAALAAFVRGRVDLADIAMLFVVSIALAAAFVGRGPSIAASGLAVVLFDFFFVPPYGTFAVTDVHHVLTFAVMMGAGVLISSLTESIRRQTAAARDRERRTASLYALTRELAAARDVEAIARVAAAQIREVFESDAVLLLPNGAEGGVSAGASSTVTLTEVDLTVARWAFEHGRPAGRGLETLPGARVVGVPLLAEAEALGVLAVLPSPEDRFEDAMQRHQLATFVAQIALALERAMLAADAALAEVRAETEEMRSSLLSSVSHDLRTPIATIMGTASTLLDARDTLSDSDRTELVTNIRDESNRLGMLVANLLEMTRVESGSLEPRREWVPAEELVGAVLHRLEARLQGHELTLHVPGDVVAHVDPVLFEQVIINLLENATKHTPPATPIDVSARAIPGFMEFEVADRGPGVPLGQEERIFEKFVRGAARQDGAGLGLAICRGIVRAHGGTITVASRDGGGARFLVTIPQGTPPPGLADEAETDLTP